MDAIVFMLATLAITIKIMFFDDRVKAGDVIAAELEDTDIERVAKINEAFYECPDAFMLIVNALPIQRK